METVSVTGVHRLDPKSRTKSPEYCRFIWDLFKGRISSRTKDFLTEIQRTSPDALPGSVFRPLHRVFCVNIAGFKNEFGMCCKRLNDGKEYPVHHLKRDLPVTAILLTCNLREKLNYDGDFVDSLNFLKVRLFLFFYIYLNQLT